MVKKHKFNPWVILVAVLVALLAVLLWFIFFFSQQSAAENTEISPEETVIEEKILNAAENPKAESSEPEGETTTDGEKTSETEAEETKTEENTPKTEEKPEAEKAPEEEASSYVGDEPADPKLEGAAEIVKSLKRYFNKDGATVSEFDPEGSIVCQYKDAEGKYYFCTWEPATGWRTVVQEKKQ